MKYTVIYHATPADAANGLKSSKEFLDFEAAVDFYHGCVSARMGAVQLIHPDQGQGDTTEAQTCDQGNQGEAPMLVLIKRAKSKMTSIQLLPKDQALAIWDQLLKEDQMYVANYKLISEASFYYEAIPVDEDLDKSMQLMTPAYLQDALDSLDDFLTNESLKR